MSYLDSEKSVSASQPVELFKFVGTYANYYYTSAPQDIEYDDGTLNPDGSPVGPVVYTAINVDRDEVHVGTQDDDGLNITVTMSVLQTVAIDYAFTVSPPDLDLTIYRQQPDETVIYWTGPVTNITVLEGGRAQFTCPSALGAALTANVPNVYYQTPCNNVLYSAQCQVDYALFSFETTVTAISDDGQTLTVGGIGTLDGKMVGGELALTNGERRMVVSQTGDSIVVNFPFSRIEVGIACTIAAGCDQDYTGDCKTKFNNQIHFNGFRFIPPVNPFRDGIAPAEDGVTDDACVYSPPAYWATLDVNTTFGPNVPVIGPWSWQVVYSRGGVQLAHLYSSGGGNGTGPVYDGGGAHGDPPPYNYLNGWQTIIDIPHNATDPFIDGPPDHVHIDMQWPYSNWIFPGDSTFGGDHGDIQFTLNAPAFGAISTPVFSGIFGLWPSSWDFDL